MKQLFTSTIWQEDEMFVAHCPEIDIASQGNSIEEAKMNLKEAVELFFEFASLEEVKERVRKNIYFSTLEVELGEA